MPPATPAHAAPAESLWDWGDLRVRARREARRLMRDDDQAEDAAQEAMIRAWRQRPACRSRDAPEPWLRQIARNEALRLVQRDRAHPMERLDGENEQADVVSEGLEERAVRRLSVDQALAQLTEEDRQLVQLRYRLDLSQVAIAEALGIAEPTVRVRLHRIRKRLRTLIGDLA